MKSADLQQDVAGFLRQLIMLAERIYETARQEAPTDCHMMIRDQVEDFRTAVNTYILDKLTPVTAPRKRDLPGYYNDLERLERKSEAWAMGHSAKEKLLASETVDLFKARLFAKLHRLTLDDTRLSEVPANELHTYLEAEVLPQTGLQTLYYSNELATAGWNALKDLADYLIDQRRRAPQTQLFS